MNLEKFYLDLKRAGGLVSAINNVLSNVGSSIKAGGLQEDSDFSTYARIEAGNRFSQVYIAENERLFLIGFWRDGVQYGNAMSNDINESVTMIQRWIEEKCDVTSLGKLHSVKLTEGALEFDNRNEVEYHWQSYLGYSWSETPELIKIIQLASHEAELRQLFPFTSMNRLCFSRCTGFPYSRDLPYICPTDDGSYEVLGANNEILGSGTATDAIRLTVENIPKDSGPAVAGTMEK